jgi:hypothetical protein
MANFSPHLNPGYSDQRQDKSVQRDKLIGYVAIPNRDRPPLGEEVSLRPFDSPSRSKRGSPMDEVDEDGYEEVGYQKKKKKQQAIQNLLHQSSGADPRAIDATMMIGSIPSNHRGGRHSPVSDMSASSASTRYALSRFPFPAFITRFNSDLVSVKRFKEEITKRFQSYHQITIEILNCRSSRLKCTGEETDFLLYLKDASSFAALLDHAKWPPKIAGEEFSFPSSPSIPPPLSLIVKNVDVRIELAELSSELKALFPEVKNVIRMRNKVGNCINLLKLELTSPIVRQSLLDAKRVILNYLSYEICEYLAPASVLICSKCSGLGHFRKQCTEEKDTCKTCGQAFADLKAHRCSAEPHCKHCNGEHSSNSLKCPVIKQFRAELTRKSLNNNQRPNRSTVSPSAPLSNSAINYRSLPSDFPPLPLTRGSPDGALMSKIDELIVGLSKVSESLVMLCASNEDFKKFMLEKNKHDITVDKEITVLKVNDDKLASEVTAWQTQALSHDISINRFNHWSTQLFLPFMEDMVVVVSRIIKDSNGTMLDSVVGSRLEQYKALLIKTNETNRPTQ